MISIDLIVLPSHYEIANNLLWEYNSLICINYLKCA